MKQNLSGRLGGAASGKLNPMKPMPRLLPDGAMDELKMDRSVVRVTTLAQADEDDRVFWQAQTIAVRLAQVERLRQMNYGYDPATARMQKIIGARNGQPGG